MMDLSVLAYLDELRYQCDGSTRDGSYVSFLGHNEGRLWDLVTGWEMGNPHRQGRPSYVHDAERHLVSLFEAREARRQRLGLDGGCGRDPEDAYNTEHARRLSLARNGARTAPQLALPAADRTTVERVIGDLSALSDSFGISERRKQELIDEPDPCHEGGEAVDCNRGAHGTRTF